MAEDPEVTPGPASVLIPDTPHASLRLLKIALLALLLGIGLLVAADWTDEVVSSASKEQLTYKRRLEAVEGWATQVRLQGVKLTSGSKPATQANIDSAIEAANYQLGLDKPPSSNRFLARLEPFFTIVLGVTRKIAAALIIFALLASILAGAAALMPWLRTQIDKLFAKTIEPPEAHDKAPSGRLPYIPAGGAGVAAIAPMAIAASAAGATAALVIGAITITVPRNLVTANLAPATTTATYDIKPITITVPSTPVNVRPEDIKPPHVNTEIPPLAFHFPEIPVDKTALAQFTTAMTGFSLALQQQREHDARLDVLINQVLELQKKNTALETTLALRPTTDEINHLNTAVSELHDTDAILKGSLDPLREAAAKEAAGATVHAVQYLRSLNAENDHFVNQLFRPGLIKQNCATYADVVKTANLADAAPCTQKGWRDLWRFLTLRSQDASKEAAPANVVSPPQARTGAPE
jgi:hypothetical protein